MDEYVLGKYNKEKYNQMFRDIRKERKAKAKQEALNKRERQINQRMIERGIIDLNKKEEDDDAEAKPPEDNEFALGMLTTGLDSPRL